MAAVEWTADEGWQTPRILPYQNLSLDPASSVLHYAFECFEGMKAYVGTKKELRLFRPDKNMKRFNDSCSRLCLPTFDGKNLTEIIGRLVKIDKRFVPEQRGYSLYLRPTMISTQRTLGVGPPGSALLFVIACPVGPYYKSGFKAVSLEASTSDVRAWPGGVGDRKLGSNYAPSVKPSVEAAGRGFSQVLWLFGEEAYITEVGTMNLFFVFQSKETKEKEIVTPPLDGTILPGVTRDSILQLARTRFPDHKISERKFTMHEVKAAAEEGRLLEAFGAGTAVIVSPIKSISWKGETIDVPLQSGKEAGPVAEAMYRMITDIQYGDVEHEWGWKIPE